MNLTAEQKQAIEKGEAVPVTVDHTDCILIRKDVYDSVRSLLDDSEWPQEELRHQLAKSAEANGWNEPEMDDYDRI